jgi:hypothetical protein
MSWRAETEINRLSKSAYDVFAGFLLRDAGSRITQSLFSRLHLQDESISSENIWVQRLQCRLTSHIVHPHGRSTWLWL